jgi:MFS family permease
VAVFALQALVAGVNSTTTTTFAPDGGQLPGTDVLNKLSQGIAQWALIAALVGIVVGAAAWGLGHYSQNYHQAYNGRKGLLVSAAAALVIGAAPSVITFFENLGRTVHP